MLIKVILTNCTCKFISNLFFTCSLLCCEDVSVSFHFLDYSIKLTAKLRPVEAMNKETIVLLKVVQSFLVLADLANVLVH